MRAQGIATQGVFMQKVPNTFVGVTPFSLVLSCLLFIRILQIPILFITILQW